MSAGPRAAAFALLLVASSAGAHGVLSGREVPIDVVVGAALVQAVAARPFEAPLGAFASGDFLLAGEDLRRVAPGGEVRWSMPHPLPGAGQAQELSGVVALLRGGPDGSAVAVVDADGRLDRVVAGPDLGAGRLLAADLGAQYGVLFGDTVAVAAWAPDGALRWATGLAAGQAVVKAQPLPDGSLAALVRSPAGGALDLRVFDREGRIAAAWALGSEEFQPLKDSSSMVVDGPGGLLVAWTHGGGSGVDVAVLRDGLVRRGHQHVAPHAFEAIRGVGHVPTPGVWGGVVVFGTLRTSTTLEHAAVLKFLEDPNCTPDSCSAAWIHARAGDTRSRAVLGTTLDGTMHLVEARGCLVWLPAECPVPDGTWLTTLEEGLPGPWPSYGL